MTIVGADVLSSLAGKPPVAQKLRRPDNPPAGEDPMSFSEILFALVLIAIVLAVPCSVALAMYLKGQRRPYYQLRR